jgi:hypothetical protein
MTIAMSFSSSAAVSFAVSITLAENQIGSNTLATIDGSTIDTTGRWTKPVAIPRKETETAFPPEGA